MATDKTITIIGGGLAGLTCAILLNRAGFEITVIEKRYYPFHRVCGEYISNEVIPFFKSLNIHLKDFSASQISKLAVSSPYGTLFKGNLDLGGFGISRYTLDEFMYEKAKDEGVHFILGLKANDTSYRDSRFETQLSDGSTLISSFLISAHGKRSNLDKNRKFFLQRSPYLGVKYHIKTDFPTDLIQLDNFEGGYCGTVKIEDDRYNLCYLIENKHLKHHGTIEEMEKHVLFSNPFLKNRFLSADFLNEKPEVINEISFEKKPLVENHILYCGDSAGMISPLCGNGMAMAIHSAKLLSEAITEHYSERAILEETYRKRWSYFFENRLKAGRLTQRLFGSNIASEIAVKSLKTIPKLSQFIMKRTHGNPF